MTDGYVTAPGKFAGQALWVPQAYKSTLDGLWDSYGNHGEGDDYNYLLTIVDDEMKSWNLDPTTYAVCITTDSSGFVYGDELTREQYEEFMQKND